MAPHLSVPRYLLKCDTLSCEPVVKTIPTSPRRNKELRPVRDFSPSMLLYGALSLFRSTTNFHHCHALLSFVTSSLASPTTTLLASNPGPHQHRICDRREEGLGKLPAIFGFYPDFRVRFNTLNLSCGLTFQLRFSCMNHRVSIAVSSTSATESGLGMPEVCSKASCLSKSVFSKECVHCTFFFIVEPCAEFTCSSPLVLCHSYSFSGQRSTVVPTHQALHSNRESRFIHFFLLFFSFLFFCQLTIDSRALRLSVCRELQASDEKYLTPQRHVFSRSSQYPYGERMFEEGCLKKANPRSESYTSGSRTPSVDLRFRSFSIKPVV